MWSLAADEARIFLVDPASLEPAAAAARYGDWLAPDELARWRRYIPPVVRHEFMVTRGLGRRVLAELLGAEPRALSFELGPYGRPELRDAAAPPMAPGRRLRFNLSNTRGLVACAVAWDVDIGVDVEAMDRATETVGVADRFFSEAEVAGLRALAPEKQRRRFFELWTLKEAYIKARGLGLAIPLGSFSFSLGGAARPTATFDESAGDPGGGWFFEQAFPSPRHAMALAVRGAPGPLRTIVTWLDAP